MFQKYFAFNHFENQENAVMTLAGLANNYVFLEIRTETRGCLVDCAKKNAEAAAGAGWRGSCHCGSHAFQKSTIAAVKTIISVPSFIPDYHVQTFCMYC